jgi:uncharacterized membrane protein YozB (DUF420 family)
LSSADLPLLNAVLNASAAILLITGRSAIKNGARVRHERLMLAALSVSAAFLASYLTYHALHGSTRFSGPAPARAAYLAILLSHTVLAVVNLPLIAVTVIRAKRGRFAEHRRIAVWTWRSWVYVSVTGVVVYLMLYQLWPAQAVAAVFQRAEALHAHGQDEQALELYKQAEDAGHPGAACFRAVLDDRLHDTETASRTIAAALRRAPDDPWCLALEGRELIFSDQAADALPLLEKAAKSAPEDAFVLATLGFAEFRNHRYPAAADAFERSIALDPLPANVYNAGYARFLAGDYPGARPLLTRSLTLELDPELAGEAKEHLEVIDGVRWLCPMHPDQGGRRGDKCPVCGMALEPASRGLAP